MRKAFAACVAALVLVTGSAALASAPAQAGAPPTCPDNYMCWFDSNNWTSTNLQIMPGWFQQGVCYNMPSGWDNRIDSVWWNEVSQPWTYAEFYDGPNCTIRAVTRVYAWTNLDNQKQSCVEPAVEWLGPCGPPNNVSRRISSWAFRW